MSAPTYPMNSLAILNREFFEIRAKLLELGASFDRLDRAGNDLSDDPRMQRIRAALDTLTATDRTADRAEQIQLIFSRAYDDDWQAKYFEEG
jgi:hypothetical protein